MAPLADPWRRKSVLTIGALIVTAGTTLLLYLVSSDKVDDLVLTVGASGVGYLIGASRQVVREEREARRLRRAQLSIEELVRATGQSSGITIGRLHIPDVLLVVASPPGEPYTKKVRFSMGTDLAAPRPKPPEWDELERRRLPQLVAAARHENRLFQNGPRVDLVDVRLRRELQSRTEQPTVYDLTLAPTDYFSFACLSNSLDQPLSETDGRTLREVWAVDFNELGDVSRLPAPACIGTATVVVTAEDQMIVCHERSRLFQVGEQGPDRRRSVHFVGEGMLPSDRQMDAELSPLQTVRRGLSEELSLVEHDDADIDIFPTGFFVDLERWQPMFSFVAYVPGDFAHLAAQANFAKDAFENRKLTPRPFSVLDPGTRDLLLDLDGHLALASNHAATALLLALLQRHDLQTIEHYLAGRHR